jgi:F-type H+-transporting ATPase subunit delta
VSDTSRVEAYATAFFEVAQAEDAVDKVEDELFRFARIFEGSDQLRETLTDPHLPAAKRQAIVEDMLGGRASSVTTNLVSFVVGGGRARELPAIADRFVAKAAEQREHIVGEVRSAIPLDDSQRERLARALSKATGKQVDVKVIVDPTLMGGVVARIGDTIIDGSIRHRLEQLKEKL